MKQYLFHIFIPLSSYSYRLLTLGFQRRSPLNLWLQAALGACFIPLPRSSKGCPTRATSATCGVWESFCTWCSPPACHSTIATWEAFSRWSPRARTPNQSDFQIVSIDFTFGGRGRGSENARLSFFPLHSWIMRLLQESLVTQYLALAWSNYKHYSSGLQIILIELNP